MIEFLKKVSIGKERIKNLTYEEAYLSNKLILNGKSTDIQTGSFWASMRIKHETVEELNGIVDSLKEETNFIETDELQPVDLAIGYDGKNRSLHILPASIFIAAGAGAKVVGHGCENVPSKFGITYYEVINAMGCNILSNEDEILKTLELSGFGFYHQRYLNPKLYSLLPKRREFGLRNYLNSVEKLLNPFKTTKVVIGVAHSNFIDKYIQLGFHVGFKDIYVVKGLEGGIELFPNKETKVYTNKIITISIFAKEINSDKLNSKISLKENAEICINILKSKDKIFSDWAIKTAGLIIFAYGLTKDIREATELAEESLKSGAAYESFEIYKSLTKR